MVEEHPSRRHLDTRITQKTVGLASKGKYVRGSWFWQLLSFASHSSWRGQGKVLETSGPSRSKQVFRNTDFICKRSVLLSKMSGMIKVGKVETEPSGNVVFVSRKQLTRGVKRVLLLVSNSKIIDLKCTFYLPSRGLLFCRAAVWPTLLHHLFSCLT